MDKKKSLIPKQQLFVKVFHTINLISLMFMAASGLRIYNANPVFGGRAGWDFPDFLLLGAGLKSGRHWHFASMWFFSMSFLIYGCYILITRRWRKRFVASNDVKALQGTNPKRKNYAWHRIIYSGIIPVLLLAIASGLCMYKPAQFALISNLFGSWQILRVVHFMTIPILLIFLLLHSFYSLKAGGFKLIRSMFF